MEYIVLFGYVAFVLIAIYFSCRQPRVSLKSLCATASQWTQLVTKAQPDPRAVLVAFDVLNEDLHQFFEKQKEGLSMEDRSNIAYVFEQLNLAYVVRDWKKAAQVVEGILDAFESIEGQQNDQAAI